MNIWKKHKTDSADWFDIAVKEFKRAEEEYQKSVNDYEKAKEEYNKAVQISNALFGGDLSGLSAEDIMIGMKMVPSVKLEGEISLLDLLVNNEICSSRREAREMLASNAISLNNEKYTDENFVVTKDMAIDNKIIVIKKGKKKQYIGIFE